MEFSMKSTFADKCKEVGHLLRKGGIIALLRKSVRYVSHLLGEQSRFVYFVFSLDQPFPNFHLQYIGYFSLAYPKDSKRIEAELFPFITEEEENDKRGIL